MKDSRISMKDSRISMKDSRISMKVSRISMKDSRISMKVSRTSLENLGVSLHRARFSHKKGENSFSRLFIFFDTYQGTTRLRLLRLVETQLTRAIGQFA